MEPGEGFVPGANLNAGATTRSMLIPHSHGRAFFHIIRPFFVTVLKHFIARTYGTRRALSRALLAFFAKILQSEVDGLVHGQGKVCCYHGRLETWPQKWVQHDVTNATHLAQARPKQNGRDHHLIIPCVVGAGGVAQTSNILGQCAGDERRSGKGEEALACADPVMSRGGLEGLPIQVNNDCNGLFVIQFHLLPTRKRICINGIGWQMTNSHNIGAKEIGHLLDVAGHGHRIVRKGGS